MVDSVCVRIGGKQVHGVGIDSACRCSHYHSNWDVVAIKFACCGGFYSCIFCHRELSGHEATLWKAGDFDQIGILCGACGLELSISEYLKDGSQCPGCGHLFNPGCRLHRHLYFEVPQEERPPEGEAALLDNKPSGN